MRRIVKQCHLSTEYKQWHDDLETANSKHPPYTSKHAYYLDVAMNLFHCQGGLCAYTEVLLCSPDEYDAGKWTTGRYSPGGEVPARPQFFGQLEHFDTALKQDRGWLWDNLFMVDSDINTKVKRRLAVDAILKPDDADYNPFERLEYDLSLHVFIPLSSLTDELRRRVNQMILTLGINHGTVRQRRIALFSPLLKRIEFGLETWDTASTVEFPTAFEMIKSEQH